MWAKGGVNCRDLVAKDLWEVTEVENMAVGKSIKPKVQSSGHCCLGCNCENAWQRRFCRRCGQSLTTACERCQFANGLGDSYCGGCGDELAVAKRQQSYQPERVHSDSEQAVAAPNPSESGPGALAQRLSALNAGQIKTRKVNQETAESEKTESDIGQEQIDALFA